HRFSPGPEILAYFEDVARRWRVDTLVRYGREVTGCAFERGRWRLALCDGATDEADFVVAATGVLHHPAYPEIPGVTSFTGPCFHSARWDHSVAIAGKRGGVVGTGSSAIQIVGAVVDEVAVLRALSAHAAVGRADGESRLFGRGEGFVPAQPGG